MLSARRMTHPIKRWPDTLEGIGPTASFFDQADVEALVSNCAYQKPGAVPTTWWEHGEVGSNRSAKSEIKALFPGIIPFDTPKPERLLHRIILISTMPGDLVLDCFAGSGTTAAVAHKMGRRWVTSELLSATVETYTKPRLLKVITGQDPGGVTTVTERVAADGLDLGDTLPQDAQMFNTLLNKLTKELDGLDTATIKSLRAATKTRDATTKSWHGGGGFTHLCVSESMFVESGGRVFLADWAVNGALTHIYTIIYCYRIYDCLGLYS